MLNHNSPTSPPYTDTYLQGKKKGHCKGCQRAYTRQNKAPKEWASSLGVGGPRDTPSPLPLILSPGSGLEQACCASLLPVDRIFYLFLGRAPGTAGKVISENSLSQHQQEDPGDGRRTLRGTTRGSRPPEGEPQPGEPAVSAASIPGRDLPGPGAHRGFRGCRFLLLLT